MFGSPANYSEANRLLTSTSLLKCCKTDNIWACQQRVSSVSFDCCLKSCEYFAMLCCLYDILGLDASPSGMVYKIHPSPNIVVEPQYKGNDERSLRESVSNGLVHQPLKCKHSLHRSCKLPSCPVSMRWAHAAISRNSNSQTARL